ncbi:serine/threonine-protein kinase [Candidatus Uabimicrobium amorphum]|uniref:non-specific serine/threonine protein kinase n=1 Tax=Uabimicrobium amorphum TaxID=2596890 RepID=A0A5S9F492_UABAM|nr:serine/threonine-protein kinase [Candidatus Uabimicrobium amorphum]BBM85298.1 putative serine/threonine-protein kinase PknB [Candidatus Uabimicrobium amorphum]
MSKKSTNSEIDFLLEKPESAIDKYEIIKVLGQGGMGIVYLAHDPQLNRNVALKIIHRKSSTTTKRFLLEAKAISMLDHPNIVKIYHLSNTEKGAPYIAMEYIEGTTLKDYLKTNPQLTIQQKVQLITPILDAIHYAHQKGIIHRDIKPANILIDRKGNPLLMDFGLAKALDLTDETLTQEGIVVGTIGYMSPEQAWSASVKTDSRTDIYSCGIVLYEMLTNKTPISAKNIIEYIQYLSDRKITLPRKHNKEIPLALQKICLKALEKNKRFRYQTAQHFAKDLRIFCHQSNLRNVLHFHYKYLLAITLLVIIGINWTIFQNIALPVVKEEPPIDIIVRWTQNGFYDKARQELDKIKKKLPDHVYHQYRCMLAAKKQDDLSLQQHYNLLAEKHKYADIVQLALAENYMTKKMWSQALQALSKAKGKLSAFYVPYYTGKIYYHMEKFSQARKQFLLAKSVQTQNDYIDIEIAKCHLQLREYAKIYNALINMPDKARFPEVYFLLGRSAIGQNQYSRAQRFFQKQLQITQPQSKSYYWLAKALIHQKKYREASTYLQKARSLAPTNLEIFKEYTSIAIYDTNLVKDRYLEFFTALEKWRYTPQTAINAAITNIRDKNAPHYLQMKTLSQQKFSQQQCALFVQKLSNVAIAHHAKKALFLMRYSKHIHIMKEKFPRLYNEIIAVKRQELQSALYYQLASISLNPSYQHSLSISQIKNVATNNKLSTLHRYIAVKSLVHLLQIKFVNTLRLDAIQSRDIHSEAIYDCALRSVSIHPHLSRRKLPYLPDAELILLPNFFLFYQPTDNDIQILLKQRNSITAVITALNHYRLTSHHKQSMSTIRKFIFAEDSSISDYTIFNFFSSMSRNSTNSSHKELWTNLVVRLPIINEQSCQAALQVAINKEMFIPTKIIQQLLKKQPSIPTAMLIFNYLAKTKQDKEIQNYYTNATHNSNLRLYAYYKHFTTELLTKYRGVTPQIFFKEKDDFLRSYAYIMYAHLGEEILHFIEKEPPHMKAFMLKASVLPVLPIIGKANARLPKDVRYAIMQKYRSHTNDHVRKHAYNAEIYARYDSENLDEFIENCIQTQDMIVRVGVANAIRDRLISNIEINDRHFIEQLLFFTQKYHPQAPIHIHRYFKNSLNKNMAVYKKMLWQIKRLDKWSAGDFYRNAMILDKDGQKKQAIQSLKMALSMDNNILYHIELAKLIYSQQKSAVEDTLVDIYKLNQQHRIYPEYHVPLLKIEKSALLEKILLLNYIQQAYKGSHIAARLYALQNLVTYYRDTKNDNDMKFYLGVLRHQRSIAPKDY